MMQVQIILFDGFDELDAIAPFEVLRNATEMGADVQVELVALDDCAVITGAHGLQVQPGATFEHDSKPDILIVPGGGWGNRAPQGAWAEAPRGEIPAAIAQLHQNGTTIASVCTGAMLVAAAGLLRGRPATTHRVAIEALKGAGAAIVDARVVDDGDIVTAAGVTSGLDLALWLLERYFTPEIAHKIETKLEYERRGKVWQRSAVVVTKGSHDA